MSDLSGFGFGHDIKAAVADVDAKQLILIYKSGNEGRSHAGELVKIVRHAVNKAVCSLRRGNHRVTYFPELFRGRFRYARRGDHFVTEGGNRSATGNFARLVTAHPVADDEKRCLSAPERQAFEAVLIDFSLHAYIGFTAEFH